jgi:GTPase SAR1 family protein
MDKKIDHSFVSGSVIERIAKFDQILVKHSQLSAAMEGINRCVSWSRTGREPRGFLLTGAGGTGKTTLCHAVLRQFPQTEVQEGLTKISTVPAFYSSIPSPSSIKGLAANLLHGLGDPYPYRGTTEMRSAKLVKLLVECRTKVIILDEFHHLANASTPEKAQAKKVCEWIRAVTKDTGVMFCLVGIPGCEAVVDYDDQMRRRFADRYRLEDLVLGTEKASGDLIPYLCTLGEKAQGLIGITAFPDFKDHTFVSQIWLATAGRPAFISLLIKDALFAALSGGGRDYVTIGDFAAAFESGCSSEFALCQKNPFLMTRAELASQARLGDGRE